MTEKDALNWRILVKQCAEPGRGSINVGSKERRSAILAVDAKLQNLQPRKPWEIGDQILNATEARALQNHLRQRVLYAEAGIAILDLGDEILRRLLRQYIAVNGLEGGKNG